MYEIEKYVDGMSVLDNVYDKIYDYDWLYDSYLEARKGKRYKNEVMRFTDDLEGGLIGIQNDLIWESYEIGRYRPFRVYEPKTRIVMSIPFRDRIVQWSIYKLLMPFYDKTFIDDSFACRRGKGSHAAADRLQYWLHQVDRRRQKYYYLKLDISKYFYRVDHDILFAILSNRIKDERLLALLKKLINCESQKFGLPVGMKPDECPYELWLDDVGMPIGNLTSQLFANIYLDQLDQFCKHKLKLHYYIRYMDDVIILSDNKEELHKAKCEIECFLNEVLSLSLNNKTAIRPISLGIDFVGYRLWATHRLLKKETARRILRRTASEVELIKTGKMEIEELDRKMSSYNGVMLYCNSNGLRRKLADYYRQVSELKIYERAVSEI